MSGEQPDPRIEELTSAWRPADVRGGLGVHPVWHDLDERERVDAFCQGAIQREMEAALDPEGLSTTARAVLARIASAS